MFISFIDPAPEWGVVLGDGIISGKRLMGGRFGDLKAIINAGELEAAADEAQGLDADRMIANVRFLPPIIQPDHIFCLGLNYQKHAAESGKTAPSVPRIFLRAPSSLTGHGSPVFRPKVSDKFDFEGELAVIIGRAGRHISEARALDHVAGYTCFMDGSVRDWQDQSVASGKNFHASGPLGPYLVPASAVPDPTRLTLVTRLNGQELQRATTDQMMHPIPRTIAFLSKITELKPGDIIATGTPEGIGRRRDPPIWLQPGDRIEVEISSLGCLSNPVEAEA